MVVVDHIGMWVLYEVKEKGEVVEYHRGVLFENGVPVCGVHLLEE